MNHIFKILVFVLFLGFLAGRTSGHYSGPDSFQQTKIYNSIDKKAYFLASKAQEENDTGIKWKRRHKRRKKAPNRRPQRGR